MSYSVDQTMKAMRRMSERRADQARPRPGVVLVDRSVEGNPLVRSVVDTPGDTRVIWVNGREAVVEEMKRCQDPFTAGKRTLYLTRHKGEFLKKCPGSPGQICCGYRVLNVINNCPFDCTYCIMQSYLNFEPITIYVNIDNAIDEVKGMAAREPGRLFRVGTGELGDSLATEPWVPVSRYLIENLSCAGNVVLELKTKSVNVENLIGLDHQDKVVVSWSLGTEGMVRRDEPGTIPVASRLSAAARVEEDGYLLGFHFDPIIYYENWEDDYRRLLDNLFESVDQENVIWVSLGCFRFPPALKEVVSKRSNRTRIFLDEFIPCPDGKMRYLRPVREEIYGRMREWLMERAPSTEIYLCMESSLMWENVFSLRPEGDNWLSDRLDRAVMRRLKAFQPSRISPRST